MSQFLTMCIFWILSVVSVHADAKFHIRSIETARARDAGPAH